MAFYSAAEWATTYFVLNTTFNRARKVLSFIVSGDLAQLLYWYTNADPLEKAIWLMFLVAFVCWLLSIIFWNFSQVDRLWSIMPCVYVWHFVLHTPLPPPGHCYYSRLYLMGILTTLWGARLSFNFYRKGGYNCQEEDYRWPILRQKLNIIFWHLFNLFFIAFYQNILLLALSLPSYIALLATQRASQLGLQEEPDLTIIDYIAVGAWLVFLVGETVADQQQWNFHLEKRKFLKKRAINEGKIGPSLPSNSSIHKKKANKKKAPTSIVPQSLSVRKQCEDGFLQSGLFTYSRHPNLFCELSLWWCFYFFSVGASGVWLNWSITGAILLTLLVHCSTNFSESISFQKYAKYAQYQTTTSRLIPWFSHHTKSRLKKKS